MDLSERPSSQSHRHPWESARFEFFAGVCGDLLPADRPLRVLDAGSGDAWFAARLSERLPAGSTVACWDLFYTDDDLADLRAQAPPALSFHREQPEGSFDLLLLLDVLEHIDDDEGVLTSLVGQLEPGASALLSVPAWSALFSQHDVALKHFRRYSPGQLRDLAERCGLERVTDGGLFHSLLLPRALTKIQETVRPGLPAPTANLGTWRHGALVTASVLGALRLDNWVSRRCARWGIPLPGLSWWGLWRRP